MENVLCIICDVVQRYYFKNVQQKLHEREWVRERHLCKWRDFVTLFVVVVEVFTFVVVVTVDIPFSHSSNGSSKRMYKYHARISNLFSFLCSLFLCICLCLCLFKRALVRPNFHVIKSRGIREANFQFCYHYSNQANDIVMTISWFTMEWKIMIAELWNYIFTTDCGNCNRIAVGIARYFSNRKKSILFNVHFSCCVCFLVCFSFRSVLF